MIKITSSKPMVLLGPYPHPLLYGHAGIAPISNKIKITNKIVLTTPPLTSTSKLNSLNSIANFFKAISYLWLLQPFGKHSAKVTLKKPAIAKHIFTAPRIHLHFMRRPNPLSAKETNLE